MDIRDRDEWAQGSRTQLRSIPNTIYNHMEIHHSAGSQAFTDAKAVALIQQYYRLHTKTNGWSDLFYNYIIDSRGVVWAGRKDGLRSSDDRAALTVVVLGNFETAAVPEAVKQTILTLNEERFPDVAIDWHRARAIRKGRYHSACPGKHMIQWLETAPQPEGNPMDKLNAEDRVQWCYDNILHRAPDTGGFDYWTNRLVEGSITVNQMRWEFQAVRNAAQINLLDSTADEFIKDLIDLAKNV